MSDFRTITVPLQPGKVTTLLRESGAAAGTRTVIFTLDSDSVLISLFVESIGAGTLKVDVYTQTEDGRDIKIIDFPSISGPTADLILKKPAVAMGVIRVVVVTTATATFEVRAKGLSAGETSVRILGANDWQVSQITITTAASILIAAALTDRSGLVIKNYSAAGGPTLFLAESLANATSVVGYPIGPGESLGMDLAAGESVYGVASSGTIDVRLAEAGNG